MNICVVNLRENNPYIGGVERVTYTLCREWKRLGHSVICCSKYNSNSQIEYSRVCPEFFLPDSKNANTQENLNYLLSIIKIHNIQVILNQCFPFEDINNLCYQVKSQSQVPVFTAIHYAPFQPYIGAKNNLFIKRSRSDMNIKWLIKQILLFISFYLYRGWRLKVYEKKLVRNVSHQSDIVVVLSKGYIEDFSRMSKLNNFISISNPVENKLGKDCFSKKNQVIYVGRLEYGLKRFDRVLTIWSKIWYRYPTWDLVVLGSGYYFNEFQIKAKMLGLERIYFKGFQDPDIYLNESKILLLTSSSEGFGLVIVEGKQKGCVPIVFNSFAAASELIIDGIDGYLIRPFDIDDFVNKMSCLMSNQDKLLEMSKNAHLHVGDVFSVERIAQHWIDAFKRVLL